MTVMQTDPPRPLWSDRMMIAAADLAAEQAFQDAQRARLRAHALGWGVVAGFEAMIEGDTLLIAPGYGLTALGREVYLGAHVTIDDLLATVTAACAPTGGADCASPVVTHLPPPAPRRAWVVARLATAEGCPRPALPEGCAHPGQVWKMSRQVGTLCLDIACDVDPSYLQPDPDCAAMRALRDGAPVPLPALLDDMLVLAEVEVNPDAGHGVTTATRRRLWPLAVVQDMLACCDCLGQEDVPEPAPEPAPEPGPVPVPEVGPDTVWRKPRKALLADLIDDLAGFFPRGARDLALPLGEVFKDGPTTARLLPEHNRLLRGFAAAALVVTTADLAGWVGGQYLGLFAAGANRWRQTAGRTLPQTGGTAASRTLNLNLNRMTLGDLAALTPNLADLRARRGTLPVDQLLDWSQKRVANEQALIGPGPAAMLVWMHARLGAMQTP
ncbi:MAG: hypothetical protein GW886_05750 [Rhodobacterales bacterium]|nr:hypothetical protein [Rhodobacterales bacterium]